jgi:Transmembrane domain of unknown function (DUF3566)
MTQGYPPPARGSNTGADQDTATLPKVPTAQGQGQQPGGWSGSTVSSSGSEDGSAGGGLSARLASAAATATSAATSAKGAMKTAAGEAENRSGRSRSGRGSRQPRRARLTLSHINVYSVFKFSCVLAIALFFVWLIMVGVLYGVLDVAGVFTKVNDTVQTISGDSKTGDVVTGSLVFGAAIIIGAVNIVLFIALSTIGAMVYNLCADLVGGAEVTLSERE